MPDDIDLGQDWKKMADEPPTLLVPFEHKPDRQPTRPRFVFPDGMVGEMTEALKDGTRVPLNITIFRGPREQVDVKTGPDGPAIVRSVPSDMSRQIGVAVKDLVVEMEGRTHLKLALTHWDKEDARKYPETPLVYDDQDGVHPPQVRFAIAPR